MKHIKQATLKTFTIMNRKVKQYTELEMVQQKCHHSGKRKHNKDEILYTKKLQIHKNKKIKK